MKFLSLIRWKNLIMIIFTFFVLRYCVVNAILKVNDYQLQFPTNLFLLLVLAVVLIAAAGYIINDYFDYQIDKANQKLNYIPEYFSFSQALTLYLIFSILGIGLGIFVSIKAGYPRFSLIFFIAASLLWFYSYAFKKSFLIGNLIVAFLTGLIPLLILIYDLPPLYKAYRIDILIYGLETNFNITKYWLIAYSIFAFSYTLIREIVKDIEDMEGDITFGANTMPIILGINAVKIIVITFDLILVSALIWIFYKYLNHIWSILYLNLFLIIPNLIFIFLLVKARKPKQYHLCSSLVKLIMILGISYGFLACYLFSLI